MLTPFYDPLKSYDENYHEGPFGAFADNEKYEQSGKPKYKVFNQSVFLPFGIPAGPLLNGSYAKAALDKGFDIVVYKTVRSQKYPSHVWPNILSLDIKGDISTEIANNGIVGHHNYKGPVSITNSFGVPSYEPNIWQEDLADTVKYAKNGQLVVASVQGTLNKAHDSEQYINDFFLVSRLAKETGVKAVEVNLSCPNEGHGDFLCFDIEKTKAIASGIKKEIGDIPLTLKLSYFQNDDHLKSFVEAIGSTVQGLSTVNTFPARVIDAMGKQVLPGDGRMISGVCGAAIKWAGLDMVRRLKKYRKTLGYDFKIEGVGGVINPQDYFEYREAGADVVMSATGAMWNPYLAQEIKQKINNEKI